MVTERAREEAVAFPSVAVCSYFHHGRDHPAGDADNLTEMYLGGGMGATREGMLIHLQQRVVEEQRWWLIGSALHGAGLPTNILVSLEEPHQQRLRRHYCSGNLVMGIEIWVAL